MKDVLRRSRVPLLVVSLAQLVINASPMTISGGIAEAISKVVLFLGLLLATSFIGGAVHAWLLRGTSDASLSVCLLDGATTGLLSNLIVQVVLVAMHGSSLDLVMPPSGDADPALWIWKIAVSSMILIVFGFTGLVSGGMGGGAGYLVSTWMAGTPTNGGRRG